MKIWSGFLNYLNRKTLSVMIGMYCRSHHPLRHKNSGGLCSECFSIYGYSLKRLSSCPFGAQKPNCPKCPVQCYSKDVRESMKTIMRYSGPRMACRHPVLSLYHVLNNYRKL